MVELNDSTEEGADCNFSFDFSISGGGIDNTLQPGDQFKVNGNISELFDADWNSLPRLTLLDKNSGEPLLYAQIQSDGILFTVAEGASGSMSISGVLTSSGLQAKDLGLEPGESKNMTLTVGSGSDSIVFTKPSDEPEEPSGQDPGTVDLDTFWKNAGSANEERGAWVTMEVNPFGSMDLYGSTTYPAEKGTRVPKSYGNLYVEDEIPEHDFIDVQSLEICAAVPAIKMSEYDFNDEWHGCESHRLIAKSKAITSSLRSKQMPQTVASLPSRLHGMRLTRLSSTTRTRASIPPLPTRAPRVTPRPVQG